MNKKGAIEFSMTTIMVVIIGVTVLALGLTWIRGTFEQVGGITEGSLEAAETVVGEVAFSGKVSAPASINMKVDDIKKFKILVRNQKDAAAVFEVETTSPGCISSTPSLGTISIEKDGIGEFSGSVTSPSAGCSSGDREVIGITVSSGTTYATDTIVVRIS